MDTSKSLTVCRLREILDYSPTTGIFVWRVPPKYKPYLLGKPAGKSDKDGYIVIGIDGNEYKAHRLAWFYMRGRWPSGQIDHRDTITHHNWFSNLRDVDNSGNQQNQRKAHKHNGTGLLGSSFDSRRGKFRSRIVINGRDTHLGYFPTAMDAHQAYVNAKRAYHSTNTL